LTPVKVGTLMLPHRRYCFPENSPIRGICWLSAETHVIATVKAIIDNVDHLRNSEGCPYYW